VDVGDPIAIYNLGVCYRGGTNGYPQDYRKALELWHRAAALGYAGAYCNIGYACEHGRGVEVDEKRANHYYELAAIKGSEIARYNLGNHEWRLGNVDRALKHHIIAVRSGCNKSLEKIKELYTIGHASKEDYTKALKLYQTYLDEIKSIQRDQAAAFSDVFQYY